MAEWYFRKRWNLGNQEQRIKSGFNSFKQNQLSVIIPIHRTFRMCVCTLASGWRLRYFVIHLGWNDAIDVLFGIVETLTFLLTWPAKADGYESNN